jgi:hypothetical protein
MLLGPGGRGVCRLCLCDIGQVHHRIQLSLICSLLLFPRQKEKKKGEMAGCFPRQISCAQLLYAIKSCFKGLSLNFMCTLCIGSNLIS